MAEHPNNFPKLHNAAWPGVVGKGGEGDDPCIPLDTMLDLTAAAEVDGRKFDGVDVFLFDPHVSIDATDAELEDLADRVRSRGLVVGSVVAPVWEPTGGGSAAGSREQIEAFLTQVRKYARLQKNSVNSAFGLTASYVSIRPPRLPIGSPTPLPTNHVSPTP